MSARPGYDPFSAPAEKPWWQSRTVLGALVVLLASGLRLAGVDVDQQALTSLVLDAVSLLGGALALWGRIAASRPIRRRVLPGGGAAERLRDAALQAGPGRDTRGPGSADRGRQQWLG